MRKLSVILLAVVGLLGLKATSALCGDSSIIWNRVALYDYRYLVGTHIYSTNVRNALEGRGYTILNADQLKAWMEARIADQQHSVVVNCNADFPDIIVESRSASCTLRRYLNAGGKVVWYNPSHAGLLLSHIGASYSDLSSEEIIDMLGVSKLEGNRDITEPAILTDYGIDWGITQSWIPEYYLPSTNDVTVLATLIDGRSAAWVKHYVSGDTYRGLVRILGIFTMPLIGDIQRVAEYPNKPFVLPEPTVVSNPPIPQSFLPLLPPPALPKSNGSIVFGWPTKVANVNSPEGDCEASISSDGLELYFRRPTPGWNWNLWVAKRLTNQQNWRFPIDIGSPVNIVGHTEGPSISADGLELFFSSSRPGAIGWTGVDTDYDIWVTTRETKDSAWTTPVNLGHVVNSSSWELFPSISLDGLDLYFYSSRPSWEEYGSTMWVARRITTSDSWGSPVNLGAVVGKGSHPCISPDGLSLYFQDRSSRGGYGRWDIWITRRATKKDPWREPENLGPTVNSFLDESGPCISADGQWLYFDRFEGPGYHYSDIWQVQINPPEVDSNGLRFEAEVMTWDDEDKVLEESPTECRILEENVRIGSSVVVPQRPVQNQLMFTVRANAVANKAARVPSYPKMGLYLNDGLVAEWEVQGAIPQWGIESEYKDYSTFVYAEKGIHKLEIAMTQEPSGWDWDLIVDFIDVNAVFIEETPSVEGFEIGNFSRFEWVSSGDAEWAVTSDEYKFGTYSARAGSVGDNGSTTLKLTLDCISGQISFYYKISSEQHYDYLRFYIDGTRQDEWSGNEDWRQVSFAVSPGRRTFEWVYSKDGSSYSGSDTAWIDDIVFPIE